MTSVTSVNILPFCYFIYLLFIFVQISTLKSARIELVKCSAQTIGVPGLREIRVYVLPQSQSQPCRHQNRAVERCIQRIFDISQDSESLPEGAFM